MTTNPRPVSDPRAQFGSDPAEELAAFTIAAGRSPSDCLLLIEHSAAQAQRTEHSAAQAPHIEHSAARARLVCCTPLLELWVADGRERLESILGQFQEHGCESVLAIIVLGDGYDEVAPEALEEVAGLASAQVLSAASQLLPAPLACAGVWTVGGGRARLAVLGADDPDGVELLVSPELPLAAREETAAAARAVLEGVPLPQTDAAWEQRMTEIAAVLELESEPSADGGGEDRILEDALLAALDALGRLRSSRPARITPARARAIGRFLQHVARPERAWELLTVCVGHAGAPTTQPDRILPALAADPSLAPCPHLQPGGLWLSGLEELAVIAAMHGSPTAVEARRALRAVLAVLAWWSRFDATAEAYVELMLEEDDGDALALLLRSLLHAGPKPAWFSAAR